MNSTLNVLSHNLKAGLKLGAADEAGNLLLSIADKFIPAEFAGPLLSTDVGREVAKGLVGSGIIAAIDNGLPCGSPAVKRGVREVCSGVVTASVFNAVSPHMAELRLKFEALAGLVPTE